MLPREEHEYFCHRCTEQIWNDVCALTHARTSSIKKNRFCKRKRCHLCVKCSDATTADAVLCNFKNCCNLRRTKKKKHKSSKRDFYLLLLFLGVLRCTYLLQYSLWNAGRTLKYSHPNCCGPQLTLGHSHVAESNQAPPLKGTYCI